MEAKFTKENWIFIESNLSIVANGNNIAFTAIPRHVSEIRIDNESWLDMRHRTEPERIFVQEEQKANAKLIAAAPKMYEALNVIKECGTIKDGKFIFSTSESQFRELILSALEKATK